jgi:hypothetical protein
MVPLLPRSCFKSDKGSFSQHLLNLKCLQHKIIFTPILGVPSGSPAPSKRSAITRGQVLGEEPY